MSDMTYRTVNASVRVQAGSESHARWQVFWQLDNQSPVFADDDRQMLEEIVTAVACGEQITEEHIENAAYLLKYPFTQNGYIEHSVIQSLEVEKEGGVSDAG